MVRGLMPLAFSSRSIAGAVPYLRRPACAFEKRYEAKAACRVRVQLRLGLTGLGEALGLLELCCCSDRRAGALRLRRLPAGPASTSTSSPLAGASASAASSSAAAGEAVAASAPAVHSKVTLSVTLRVTPFYWCNGLHLRKQGVTPSFWRKRGGRKQGVTPSFWWFGRECNAKQRY